MASRYSVQINSILIIIHNAAFIPRCFSICVVEFWRREMTPEKCSVYIDHIYKGVCANEGECNR